MATFSRLFKVLAASICFSVLMNVQGADAEDDPFSNGLQGVMFLSSGSWYQISGDRKAGMYRYYAVAVDENKKLLDMPNLMFLKCKEKTPYLTIHFPKDYKFRTFSDTTWLQQTNLYARNERSTYRFTAELNNNEIFVDLDPEARANLSDLFSDKSMELRFGPDGGDRIVVFEGAELFKTESGMVQENLQKSGKKIEKTYQSWDQIGACVRP